MNEVDIKTGRPQYVNTEKKRRKKSYGFGLTAEVMLELMPEVMSAETSLIK